MSGRTPEWVDWFQDLAGIAISVAVYRLGVATSRYFEGTTDRYKYGTSGDTEPS